MLQFAIMHVLSRSLCPCPFPATSADLLHEDAVQHAQCRSSFSGLPPPSPPPGSPQHDNAASMGNSTAQLATPTTTPVDSPVASPHGVPTSPPSPLSFHSPSGSPTAAAAAASSPAAQRGRAGERAAAAPGSASLGAAQRPPVPRRAPSPAASRLGPPLEQLGTLLGPSVLTKAPGSPSAAGGRAGGGALRPLLLPATAGAVTATAASRLAEHAKHAERAAAAAAAASGDEPPATPFALEPWAPTATPPPTVQGGTGESGSSDRQAQQAQQPVFYNTPLESIREASLSSLSSLASLASSRLGSPPGPSERMESSAMERMESVIEEVVNSGLASSSVAGGSGPLGGSVAGGSGPLGSGSGSDSKLGAEGGAATAAPASAGGREAAAAEPARPLPSDSSAGGSGSSSGRKSPGEAVAVESAVGSSQPAAGGTVRPRGKRSGRHTASAPSQRWDLTYTDAALESAYRDWVGPRLLSHDRIIACAYAAAAAITLLALAMRRAATWELLALHLAGRVSVWPATGCACARAGHPLPASYVRSRLAGHTPAWHGDVFACGKTHHMGLPTVPTALPLPRPCPGAGCALFLTPGLAASLPSSAAHRDSHRSGWLSGLRLATVLLYAASMVLGGPASGSQAPAPVLCMLWRTFVPCMVMGALRQVLPRVLGPLCSPARPGTRVHTLQPALCLPSHASKHFRGLLHPPAPPGCAAGTCYPVQHMSRCSSSPCGWAPPPWGCWAARRGPAAARCPCPRAWPARCCWVLHCPPCWCTCTSGRSGGCSGGSGTGRPAGRMSTRSEALGCCRSRLLLGLFGRCG